MEFITGALLTAVVWLVYDKFKARPTKDSTSKTEEQKEKDIQEHYEKLMNYNVEQAYGGKR